MKIVKKFISREAAEAYMAGLQYTANPSLSCLWLWDKGNYWEVVFYDESKR